MWREADRLACQASEDVLQPNCAALQVPDTRPAPTEDGQTFARHETSPAPDWLRDSDAVLATVGWTPDLTDRIDLRGNQIELFN